MIRKKLNVYFLFLKNYFLLKIIKKEPYFLQNYTKRSIPKQYSKMLLSQKKKIMNIAEFVEDHNNIYLHKSF